MRKLFKKTGGTIPSSGKIESDAELLYRAKKATALYTAPSHRWLLKQGMGNILDYIYHRTMKLYILANEKNQLESIKIFQQQLSDIK
jgi:hypothetical protein